MSRTTIDHVSPGSQQIGAHSGVPVRTLSLWCPDWPVIAAGLTGGVDVYGPVAVVHANRVLACSVAARAEGIRRGMRRREAQSRCPQLVVVGHDPVRDARAFEPVVVAVERVAPGVEVVRPGACILAVRGPASYYGSEAGAAERLVEHTAVACEVEAQVGIADGVFAALVAARTGQLVPPGQSASFLAGMPIQTLGRPELASLLRRLGVRTLGDFAGLPAADVLARFGADAGYAHRLAGGGDDRPLVVREPPPDLTVVDEFDPPLERVDVAAFAARALAGQLHQRLAARGLAASRLVIEARTAAGEELRRSWHLDGLLDAAAIADRTRWQLEGWLTCAGRPGAVGTGWPTAGLDRLRLTPAGVIVHGGWQPGLWGEAGAEHDRAHRALVRVQGLLGPEAVLTAVLGGGRGYADRVRLVPWGEERSPRRPGGAGQSIRRLDGDGQGVRWSGDEQDRAQPGWPPWPGQLPAPAPATVPVEPIPAILHAADGGQVRVTARLAMTGEPARLTLGREHPVEVTGWAGPWPVDERWWAPQEARRCCRLQVRLADGRALLLLLESGKWAVEGIYD